MGRNHLLKFSFTFLALTMRTFKTFRIQILNEIVSKWVIMYLYYDERRDVRLNIAWARGKSWGISQGLRLYLTLYPDSSHNTDIINFNNKISLILSFLRGHYLKGWLSVLPWQLGLHFHVYINPALLGAYVPVNIS